jgi:hypothetical protein
MTSPKVAGDRRNHLPPVHGKTVDAKDVDVGVVRHVWQICHTEAARQRRNRTDGAQSAHAYDADGFATASDETTVKGTDQHRFPIFKVVRGLYPILFP